MGETRYGTRKALRLGVSAMALALAAPMAAHADANDGTTIETVVVTAEMRAEPLQSVPLSITALTGEDLEAKGADDFQDYAQSVPGLSFADRGPNRAKIVIRGISTLTGEAAVGLYMDEIPVSNNFNNPDFRLFDVDRIEILRGPQGTLYGEGSLGGTIRIFTTEPDLDTFSTKEEVIGSSTAHGGDNLDLNAVVNIPIITDELAVRLAGSFRDDSGWIDNVYNGKKNINNDHTGAFRGAVRYHRPTGSRSRPSSTISTIMSAS